MATQTITDTVANVASWAKQYARIRNMRYICFNNKPNVDVPVRTESNPSPMKQSASHRQSGQSHTSTVIGTQLNLELATGRYSADDLADHIFGNVVSTALARDILERFVAERFVQVFEGSRAGYGDPLHETSDDVRQAIEQAFGDADEHDCHPPGTTSDDAEQFSTNTKGTKGKTKRKIYSFKWAEYPQTEPIKEDELVDFLNKVIDRAFEFARHDKVGKAIAKPNNRFAAPIDKHHGIPLSYEPDGEDMRPDFVLLPAQAFSDDSKTVDARYLNFTAVRLVGEAKNKDLAAGVQQVQRYMRGLKRAQPWVYYVLALVMTKSKAVLLRGEGSGEERLDLNLGSGRGCIEFIRIMLGVGLAEDIDLGQNPDIQLTQETRMWPVNDGASLGSNAPGSATASEAKPTANADSAVDSSSSMRLTAAPTKGGASVPSTALSAFSRATTTSVVSKSSPLNPSNTASASRTQSISAASNRGTSVASSSSRVCHAAVASFQSHGTASSRSSKRTRAEAVDDCDRQKRQKKMKKMKEVKTVVKQEEQLVTFPERVYDHHCRGLLFTSGSVRGRGSTVFSVVKRNDASKLLALKMSWQDMERVAEQAGVMERLNSNSHANVIVPLKIFNVERDGQTCTTLGAIRGFLDDQINKLEVENRALSISISELKRPVKYFWGVHDFVRGLRGALAGHEFLTSIGILHRDISENNIVLGLYPNGEERGYLIDFDMAILQDAEEPTPIAAGWSSPMSSDTESTNPSEESSLGPEEGKRVKELRTGTFPYISINVLLGNRHTDFDDVESFFYVLLLFFFSYAGPLSKPELEDAHQRGFTRPTGAGRLPHLRSWPQKFADWADGDPESIGTNKSLYFWHPNGAATLLQNTQLENHLRSNWPEPLQVPIRVLLKSILAEFRKTWSVRMGRTELSHARFIKKLDEWLERYSKLEDQFSSCPFGESRS